MQIARINKSSKKFNGNVLMNSTCNCGGPSNCNCGAQMISTNIDEQIKNLLK